MSRSTRAFASLALACAFFVLAFSQPAKAQKNFAGIGRAATTAEIAAWDIDVRPDFKGLPAGSGSVAKGQDVWEAKCATCHGTFGESNEVFAPLVGGTTADDIRNGRVKTLVTGDVARTTLMKVSTVSTLWDYINRAMPWTSPKSLSVEEVYSVVAYLLNLGDIVPGDFTLSDRNIADVQQRLPNRNGTHRDHGLWDVKGKPDVRNVACMKDCPLEAKVVSVLPEHARGAHGNLSEQYRPVGPARGTDTSVAKTAEAAAPAAASPMLELAKAKTCLACHGVDKAVVGPAFQAIAARYRGDDAALARLAAKVRAGGGGIWGAVPMPPNAAVSDEEARSLVQWILSGTK